MFQSVNQSIAIFNVAQIVKPALSETITESTRACTDEKVAVKCGGGGTGGGVDLRKEMS